MSKGFKHRSIEKEIMDDLEIGGAVLDQTLHELRIINRLLGGNYVSTSGLDQLMQKVPQAAYSIADLGCGGGDMIRVMSNWAATHNRKCSFIGIDANAHTIAFAKENLKDLPDVNFQVQNVFETSFLEDPVDLITCTLFTHHFTDEELIQLFKACLKKAKIGIVINDLHRHPVAYKSIQLLTKLFSKSDMVKNDGPLSVKRSFVKEDWARILRDSNISTYDLSWHWAFRWRLVIPCAD
ncbi:methyltransferase domain-containing protein [Mongoliitalea daihaiensis]|uniref:methyltransferase domain-containing protein n=1 Tax=Mongoliitalea daihaiensis TaxID=2782006 RepID=UPI001F299FB8|nr:methyltransferase domain-containing protein [Mongoliitalea daihaiensis]UJP65972.1 methyltransferase domain-containing protein [Mongoliitalea daihaiensis]